MNEEIEEKENESGGRQSLDDILSKALTSIEPSDQIEETSREENLEKVRDEKGRFTKPNDSQEKDLDQSEEREKEVPNEEPINPPISWSTEEKARFSELPRDVKEVISRREKERENFILRKSEELAKAQKQYAEIDDILGVRKQQLALNGITPAQYINQLVAASEFMDSDPVSALKRFADHYGVTADQLFGAQPTNDPVMSRLSQLENRILQRENLAQQQLQAQSLEQIQGEIERFRNEFDAQGRPVRPYFDSLAGAINKFIPDIRAQNPNANIRDVLDAAYQKALPLHPEYLDRVVQERLAREQAQSLERAKKRASEAKLKSSSIVGSPNGSSAQKPKGLDAILSAALENVTF